MGISPASSPASSNAPVLSKRLPTIEVPVASLVPDDRNPRTHSRKQIRQIAASIRRFGFLNPLLIDAHNRIIAGNGRLAAAKLLGMTTIEAHRIEGLTKAEIRAYVLTDNLIAEKAGLDKELLAIECHYILDLDSSFDLTVTGLDIPEIDLILGAAETSKSDVKDQIPAIDRSRAPVTQPGDLWIIGKHRLLCGDSTLASSYERLLNGARAQMVFTDPPYNVSIRDSVTGLGHAIHDEFAMASGEMTPAQFVEFLRVVFGLLATYSSDGSIHFVCMDWRHIKEILAAADDIYLEFKNLCVWNKTNAGMGSLYRSKHELVFVFKSGKAPHVNNVELGRFGRYRTNVWDYAGNNALHADRKSELALHPTVKPVAMIADAILDCSKRDGIILDAFAGSSSSLIAAERTGRRGYGIELDPWYVDASLRRFEDTLQLQAIHAESGVAFRDLSKQRYEEDTNHCPRKEELDS